MKFKAHTPPHKIITPNDRQSSDGRIRCNCCVAIPEEISELMYHLNLVVAQVLPGKFKIFGKAQDKTATS